MKGSIYRCTWPKCKRDAKYYDVICGVHLFTRAGTALAVIGGACWLIWYIMIKGV